MGNTIYPDAVEPACYPNTTTFVNLLNISSAKELAAKEAGFTFIRSIELLQHPELIDQTFDFNHLKTIHHYLFQDVYEWAGKPRSYDMRKDGNKFTPAKDLSKYEAQVFSRVAEYCSNKQRPTVTAAAKELASCLGIINIYHPFAEGNGRVQRIFISLLAKKFNYAINWDAAYQWEIIETSKQVHMGNYRPLEELIKRIIIDGRKS